MSFGSGTEQMVQECSKYVQVMHKRFGIEGKRRGSEKHEIETQRALAKFDELSAFCSQY